MRDDQVFRFDHFVLDSNQMSLVRDGTPVDLRPKAFETLLALVRDAGRLVTKDALVQAVWPSVFVNDDALSQCIRDIRKALRDNDQSFIRTVPKRGYIFVQPVTTGIVDPKKATPWGERSRAALAFGVAAMLIVLIVLVGERSQPGTQTAIGPSAASRLTLAVLPFSATDGSSADKILSQGFAEDILVALSRFADLEVIARGSSFRDVVTEADMTELGDLLKADLLLQGSMRRSGDSLRVSLQLIDPSTGTHRWAGQFDGAVSEFSALQDNMVEGIASQLVTNVRDATLFQVQGQPPDRLEVYELVLRARGLWRRFTREDTTEALQLTERALRMDPRYAVAWELLAQILLQLYIQPYDRSYADPVVLERAKKAAEEAVKLDPRYATA